VELSRILGADLGSGRVAGFELSDGGEVEVAPLAGLTPTVDRVDDVADVVAAEGEALEDRSPEPRGRLGDDRCTAGADPPVETGELVDVVARLLAEELREMKLVRGQHVDDEVARGARDAVGVVLLGKADDETGWIDRALGGEPDEAASALRTVRDGRDHHRVGDAVREPVEGSHARSVPRSGRR